MRNGTTECGGQAGCSEVQGAPVPGEVRVTVRVTVSLEIGPQGPACWSTSQQLRPAQWHWQESGVTFRAGLARGPRDAGELRSSCDLGTQPSARVGVRPRNVAPPSGRSSGPGSERPAGLGGAGPSAPGESAGPPPPAASGETEQQPQRGPGLTWSLWAQVPRTKNP